MLLAALCLDRDPVEVAAEIGDGGAAALKRVVTEAVNEFLAPIRARRAEYAADLGLCAFDHPGRATNGPTRSLIGRCAEVRAAMGMRY